MKHLYLVPALLAVFLHGSLAAQAPIVLNTTVRSFTLTVGPADVWTYIDSLGRDFALICARANGFHVWDISNPDVPVFADSIPTTGSDLKDVKVAGDYAYICQEVGDAMVVDLTDPYNISVVGTVPGIGAHNGEVGNGLWVFASVSCGTQIYSIANPTTPTPVSCISGSSHDATIDGDRLYVHSFSGTQTHIYDISNPANPVQLGTIGYGNHSGAIYDPPGNQKMVIVCNEAQSGHARIFDVTDPAAPQFVSAYQTPQGDLISIHNPVEMGDRYICISYYADYLRILDMANPANPAEVGIYDPVPSNLGSGLFDGAWGAVPLKELPGGGWRIVMGERNTPTGLYVIDFNPPAVLDMSASTAGAGDFQADVSGADASSTLYNLISFQTAGTLGAGPVIGLGSDAFLLFAQYSGSPFQVQTGSQGDWSLNLPAGSVSTGMTMDFISVGQVGGNYLPSPIGRVAF